MAKAEATDGEGPLKRLGGGRWQSRDGRFTIEPESGTWVVVDAEQTNELGLPLVRGPFPSLTAARAAIGDLRANRATSPLAARVEDPRREAKAERAGQGRRGLTPELAPPPEPPPPPPEPRWLTDLSGPDRRLARRRIEALEADGVRDATEIVRREATTNSPSVARVALARRLRRIASEASADAAVRAAIEVLADGRDDDLEVRWRLVDGDGRPIRLQPDDLDEAGEAAR